MAEMSWQINTPNQHTVTLEQNAMDGSLEVLIDGSATFKSGPMFKGEHRMQVDGKSVALRVKPGFFNDSFELWVDGKKL